MNEQQRRELGSRINQDLTVLQSEIVELKELTKPIAPENAIGRLSRMDAINNRSINEAALRKAQEKERKLRYALTRIDHTDFGICADCGQDIPIGRLLLMPESVRCVRCASR